MTDGYHARDPQPFAPQSFAPQSQSGHAGSDPMAPQVEGKSGTESELRKFILSTFATPVLNTLWQDTQDMNQALHQLVRQQFQSAPHSQRGPSGWQSGPDFLNQEQDAVHQLRSRLQKVAVGMTQMFIKPREGKHKVHFQLNGRARCLTPGGYLMPAGASGTFWSGMYFVTGNRIVPENPLSGKLELLDPRAGAALGNPEDSALYGRFLLNPTAGQVLVFPGWLQYCLHPHAGEGELVSVAFNIDFSIGC